MCGHFGVGAAKKSSIPSSLGLSVFFLSFFFNPVLKASPSSHPSFGLSVFFFHFLVSERCPTSLLCVGADLLPRWPRIMLRFASNRVTGGWPAFCGFLDGFLAFPASLHLSCLFFDSHKQEHPYPLSWCTWCQCAPVPCLVLCQGVLL